jgi:TPR repeat protein
LNHNLLADQGNPECQFRYGESLFHYEGVSMTNSLEVHYFKLSANKKDVESRTIYRKLPFLGEDLLMSFGTEVCC